MFFLTIKHTTIIQFAIRNKNKAPISSYWAITNIFYHFIVMVWASAQALGAAAQSLWASAQSMWAAAQNKFPSAQVLWASAQILGASAQKLWACAQKLWAAAQCTFTRNFLTLKQ